MTKGASSAGFVAVVRTSADCGTRTARSVETQARSGKDEWTERVLSVRNCWVHFKVGDVYFPDPAKVLRELHGEDLLQGKVLDVSDSGKEERAFVVVEVEGLAEPVVVPVECIKGLL